MSEEWHIPDTNLFIYDSKGFFESFKAKRSDKKNYMVFTIPVINELDGLKNIDGDVGYNARETLRQIDKIREMGDLKKGIDIGGLTYITLDYDASELPKYTGCNDKTDSHLIRLALKLQRDGKKVELITQDTAPRIIADIVGVNSNPWKDIEEVKKLDDLYKGWEDLIINNEDSYNKISKHTKKVELARFQELIGYEKEIYPNQYFFIRNKSDAEPLIYYIDMFNKDEEIAENITTFPLSLRKISSIENHNLEQKIALHALNKPEITQVTLLGKAGTGKTFISLDAGYNQSYSEGDNVKRYENVLVTRPIVPIGKELGFIPGDLNDKYGPWMMPIIDNLRAIVRDDNEFERICEDFTSIENPIQIQLLSDSRGRSVHNSFWIIDEAQNLATPSMKTLGTRVANKTKLVVTGDPSQSDLPHITTKSSGLVHYSERFKKEVETATILLTKGKRSRIADLYDKY